MVLLLHNLFRKPLRTCLTIFGVAVALGLFCFLEAVLFAFNAGVNMADASRLVVQHKESITFLLPMSCGPLIGQVPGVNSVMAETWFGGPYDEPDATGQKREEFFMQVATELEEFPPIYPEVLVPPDQLRDLLADPSGCVIGDKLAERIHKKLGDRIVLRGALWARRDGRPWEFTVRAIYTSDSATFDRTAMLFHHKCLNEGRAVGKDKVGLFLVSIADPNRSTEIAAAIDARFENSPFETRTMTEKAMNLQFVSMLGNLQLLFRSVGSAVVLTMLLISANTMVMNARERTREIGILKAIGFTDGRIFLLLTGEALVISALGAILGAGSTFLMFNVAHYNPVPTMFPIFWLPTESFFAAFAIAAVIGFISGLVPAVSGMRMKATEALRSV